MRSAFDPSASKDPDPSVHLLPTPGGLDGISVLQPASLNGAAVPLGRSGRLRPGRAALRLVDASLFAAAVVLARVLVTPPMTARGLERAVELTALAMLTALVVFGTYGLYRARIALSLFDEFSSVLSAVTFAALVTATISFLIDLPLSRSFLLVSWTLALVLVPLGRVSARAVAGAAAKRGLGVENVLLVGVDEVSVALEAKLRRHKELGLRVIGFLDRQPRRHLRTGAPVYTDLGMLRDLIAHDQVKQVMLSAGSQSERELLNLVRECDDLDVQFSVIPRLWEVTWPTYIMSRVEDVSLLELRRARLSPANRALKRALDLLFASVGLVVLLPLFVLIGVLIRLDSAGPILYQSRRPGRCGKPFQMLKFRTMAVGADTSPAALQPEPGSRRHRGIIKPRSDPRVTRVGRWLRKLSIDELPQLFNVLRGEMSLVGPRPLLMQEAAECKAWELRRLNVSPGITGYWQILGRSDLGFEERMRLDYLYGRNWSVLEDFRILVNTVGAVLAQRGAY